jgi:NADH-quinone oxidoreductase subunit D
MALAGHGGPMLRSGIEWDLRKQPAMYDKMVSTSRSASTATATTAISCASGMRQSARIMQQCIKWLRENLAKSCCALQGVVAARGNEGGHGSPDPSFQIVLEGYSGRRGIPRQAPKNWVVYLISIANKPFRRKYDRPACSPSSMDAIVRGYAA